MLQVSASRGADPLVLCTPCTIVTGEIAFIAHPIDRPGDHGAERSVSRSHGETPFNVTVPPQQQRWDGFRHPGEGEAEVDTGETGDSALEGFIVERGI